MYAHKGKTQTPSLLVPNLTVHSKHVIITLAQAAAAVYSTHYANVLGYTLFKAYVEKVHI